MWTQKLKKLSDIYFIPYCTAISAVLADAQKLQFGHLSTTILRMSDRLQSRTVRYHEVKEMFNESSLANHDLLVTLN